MKQGKIIGFDAAKMAEQMMANAVAEQNRRLVVYAEKEIKRLGDMIQTYHSANHMDRTGNLLNSLCWVVTYNSGIVGYGFYRSPVTHSRGIDGCSTSYLHEYFMNDMEERNGRQLAEEFIESYKGSPNKWKVAFAILADYWGYWESGFWMKSGGNTVYQGESREHSIPRSKRFAQFQVMTHVYDDVRMALKPAETHLTVYVPKYSHKNPRYKNKRGYKKIGLLR